MLRRRVRRRPIKEELRVRQRVSPLYQDVRGDEEAGRKAEVTERLRKQRMKLSRLRARAGS